MGESGMLLQYWGEGNLKKLGGIGGKTQQTRWFELRGQGLRYYSESPRGAVDLSRPIEISDDSNDAFTITGAHLSHPYTLVASDEDEKRKWMSLLKKAFEGPKVGYAEGRLLALEGEREALIATSEQLANEIHQKTCEIQNNSEESQKEVDALNTKTQQAEAETANAKKLLSSSTSDKELLRSEKEDLRNQMKALRSQMDGLSSQNNLLMSEKSDLLKEIENLKTDTATHKNSIQNLTKDKASQQEVVGKLNNNINNLNNEIQQLRDEKSNVDNDHHTELNEAEKKHCAELKKIQSDIETEREKRTEAEKAHSANGHELLTLRSRVTDLRKEVDSLQEENHILVNEAEQAERRLELQKMLENEASPQLSPVQSPDTSCETVSAMQQQPDSPTKRISIFRIRGDRGLIVREGEDVSSDFVTQLPQGSSVQICPSHLHTHTRRVKISHPVDGWVSVTTESGAELAVKADVFEPREIHKYQIGSLVERAVIRDSVLAGWVHGRVVSISSNSNHFDVKILKTAVSLALGVSGVTAEDVPAEELKPRKPKWFISDVADDCRVASSAAYNHCEGFGCNRGRLSSEFAWVSHNADKSPSYTIDIGAVQPVAGVVLAGHPMTPNYITDYQISVSTSVAIPCTVISLEKHFDGISSRSSSIISDSQASVVDFSTPVTVTFPEPVLARYVRFTATDWLGKEDNVGCALKMGLLLDGSEPHAPQTLSADYINTHEHSNKWKDDFAEQTAVSLLDKKIRAIEEYKKTVDDQKEAFEAEQADFKVVRDQLAATNATLSSNIFTLKEKGYIVQRKTTTIAKEELIGLIVDCVTVVEIREGIPIEKGMRIKEINGNDVIAGDDINELINLVPSNEVTIAADYDAVPDVIQNLNDERDALRDEIKRQHHSIQSLEAAVVRPQSPTGRHPPSPSKITHISEPLRKSSQQLPHRSKKPSTEEVVF